MKSRFKEEQIVKILKEVEDGGKVKDIARKYGISEGTYFHWKSKYGDMNKKEILRLRNLETENATLKKLVADYALQVEALKEVNQGNY
jgi:putative transposase